MGWHENTWSEKDLETAKQMRSEGASYREIGKVVGRAREAVYHRLNYKPASERPVDAGKTMENGCYSRRQLSGQNDKFAAAMRRAFGDLASEADQ